MSAPAPWHVLLPGDWHQATGGYRYDRRIGLGLRALGLDVRPLVLQGAFPRPAPHELAAAAQAVAALPDGAQVLADGLAFGAMPEIAEAHARRLRWVALVHHPLWLETGCEAPALLRAREARALAAARQVIVTSRATAGLVQALGVGPERIAVVEPGTDPAPLAEGAGPGAAPNLLCVATVTPRKGHRRLVEALAPWRARPWTLLLAGSLDRDPACVAALRAAIDAHGLAARVRLLGEVDDAALAACYRRADAFVLASAFEGYGMALAEALAHGLPVVSTTGGAIGGTVPPDAGVLVDPQDTGALSRALGRLLDDPGTRTALQAGARRARERLPTWDAACRRFAAVLEGVGAAGGGPA
ncbi:glycosyltransferase family 4 protein [Aquincola sp. MAHUQ-54]|uniref:Glycosyltransferase family 4 protein n=1 Tax=Aquincola agrisoli TaxID=3119538 RepID=A0AAW9QNJ1_9BURK